MKKATALIAAFSATMLLFAGCGSQKKQAAVYTNLADEVSRKEVVASLENHGVTRQQTDTLVSWAEDFNSRITSGTLSDGFQPLPETGADYAGLIITNNEAADGFIYPEANCRLTSYLLIKNMLTTNRHYEENDNYLIFDTEAIETYEPFYLSDLEKADYVSLFSFVPLHGASTLQEHKDLIQKAWKDREIQVEGDGVSLITVYLHTPFDDARFIGHTGVLLEEGDGLLFVEKYGPQFPFQATRFQNREQLKAYLLGRSDLYGDETELEPIVMENGNLL